MAKTSTEGRCMWRGMRSRLGAPTRLEQREQREESLWEQTRDEPSSLCSPARYFSGLFLEYFYYWKGGQKNLWRDIRDAPMAFKPLSAVCLLFRAYLQAVNHISSRGRRTEDRMNDWYWLMSVFFILSKLHSVFWCQEYYLFYWHFRFVSRDIIEFIWWLYCCKHYCCCSRNNI